MLSAWSLTHLRGVSLLRNRKTCLPTAMVVAVVCTTVYFLQFQNSQFMQALIFTSVPQVMPFQIQSARQLRITTPNIKARPLKEASQEVNEPALNNASKFVIASSKTVVPAAANQQSQVTKSKNTNWRKIASTNEGSSHNKAPVMIGVATRWLCTKARLGNKMYMTASTFVTAIRLNTTFVSAANGCEWPSIFADVFVAFKTSVKLIPEATMNRWILVKENVSTGYEPILAHNGRNLTVNGFRQTWKYFSSESEMKAVRQLFKFTTKYEVSAAKSLDKARSQFSYKEQPIFIGVHIRKGDLSESRPTTFGYQAADLRFYKTAFQKAITKLNNSTSVIFIAASDSLKVAKAMIADLNKSYNIAWLDGTAYEDFSVLSKCNHSIISGGTFGFWTAWMAGGDTYYFSQFARNGSKFEKEYNKANFFLPTWIPVSWS